MNIHIRSLSYFLFLFLFSHVLNLSHWLMCYLKPRSMELLGE